jgi:hypothetical protein
LHDRRRQLQPGRDGPCDGHAQFSLLDRRHDPLCGQLWRLG